MSRPSILLVEMDPQLSVALELFLRGRGFRVSVAATPAEALRLATAAPSDVVILGNVPDSTDAGTAAQRLRAVLAARPVSIVVLSHGIEDIPGVDLVLPMGAHPRAILDGLRTAARRRSVAPPAEVDDAGQS